MKTPQSQYGAAGPMFVFSTIAVVLRYIARGRTKAGLWWDDWLILVAVVIYHAYLSLVVVNVALFGLCRHFNSLDPVRQVIPAFRSLLAIQYLYFVVQTLVKISLLILYHRLFHPSLTIRRAIYVMGAIVLAWFVAEIFANTFRCIPVSYLWNKQQSGHCLALLHFAYQDGILNMLLDFSILCMPFPMIYRLHTDIQTRLSLAGIFVLGFFTCAVSIMRISSISDLRDQSDPTISLCNINLWSFVEPGCALIGTCLPTLKPLLPQRFKGVAVPSPRMRKYLRDDNSTDQYDLRQWKSHISVEPKRQNASKAEGFKKLNEKDMHDNGESDAIRPETGHGPGTVPLITTQIEIRSDELPPGTRSMDKLGSIA